MKQRTRTKDKTTAVCLAILFGFFGLLYTYKDDATDFWVCLVLTLVTGGIFGVVGWIYAIIVQATRKSEWFESY